MVTTRKRSKSETQDSQDSVEQEKQENSSSGVVSQDRYRSVAPIPKRGRPNRSKIFGRNLKFHEQADTSEDGVEKHTSPQHQTRKK